MKVYALVGKSGTGKSYQAMNLCRDLKIPGIIDDGLFIYNNEILAGTSAKRQDTKIGAIKTALFVRDDHRDAVAAKISEVQPESLLVIGTSDAMIEKIVTRLSLPEPSQIIYIEEITTEAEREIADRQRHQLGKHVIPVPTFQLKKDFSGYFMYPLNIFRGMGFGKTGVAERSVVRPTYSYLGEFIISEKAMADIIHYIARRSEAIESTNKINIIKTPTGLELTVQIVAYGGYQLIEAAGEFQRQVIEKITDMTAFNINYVNIEIKSLKKKALRE